MLNSGGKAAFVWHGPTERPIHLSPSLRVVIPSEVEESLAVELEKNRMLVGADPMPRIVAIELGETGKVKLYCRRKDGSTIDDDEPLHPYDWSDSDLDEIAI